jgi:hypothetical protein
MPYEKRVTRETPVCFIFLLDQSESMTHTWARKSEGTSRPPTKAEGVARAVNNILSTFVRSARPDGTETRHYHDVAVIGYGERVGSVFPNTAQILSTPELDAARQTRTDDGVTKTYWVEPYGANGTPMSTALNKAWQLASGWIREHKICLPPIVINITDGMNNDPDPVGPIDRANQLRQLSTDDGNLLLFNIHISGTNSAVVAYPADRSELSDEWERLLFDMSSPMPDFMRNRADGLALGARCCVINADLALLLSALKVGTVVEY